jgi:hypothetical protein
VSANNEMSRSRVENRERAIVRTRERDRERQRETERTDQLRYGAASLNATFMFFYHIDYILCLPTCYFFSFYVRNSRILSKYSISIL